MVPSSSTHNEEPKDVEKSNNGEQNLKYGKEKTDIIPEDLSPSLFTMSGRALSMLAFIPCIGSMLFGMDTGLTAWVLVNIETFADDGVKWFEIVGDSDVGRGVVGSSSPFGMAVGCLLASTFAEKLGRKAILILAAVCYIIGSFVTSCSGDVKWDHVTGLCLLLIGRLIYGFGNAFSMISAPAYLSETLPGRIRGPMTAAMELFIVIGISIGFWVGGLQPFLMPKGWRYYFMLPCVLGCLMLMGILFLPRSPRWLITKGGTVKEVQQALSFINPDISEEETQILIRHLKLKQKNAGQKNTTLFQQVKKGGSVAAAWRITILLMFAQQMSGQNSILYYSGLLFSNSMCGEDISWGLNLIGATKLIGALSCSFLVEELGRQKLLTGSCCGMALGMLCLASDFVTKLMQSAVAVPVCAGILVVAFYFYIFSYSLGLGPVVWVLLGELYPVSVKSEASSWALFISCALNVLITLMIPICVKMLTFQGLFFVLFFVCSVSTLVIYYEVPETKGLTLEEIQESLERKSLRGKRKSSNETIRCASADEENCKISEDSPLLFPPSVPDKRDIGLILT